MPECPYLVDLRLALSFVNLTGNGATAWSGQSVGEDIAIAGIPSRNAAQRGCWVCSISELLKLIVSCAEAGVVTQIFPSVLTATNDFDILIALILYLLILVGCDGLNMVTGVQYVLSAMGKLRLCASYLAVSTCFMSDVLRNGFRQMTAVLCVGCL